MLLLENVRYEPGETKNDPELASALASLADVYVDDAFGAAHRAHASTEGVARLVDERAAGLLLEREVSTLMGVLEDPARPLVAVLGGAKVSDKIGVIDRFREIADTILIGGAMCFPFLAAQGHSVGASLCAEDDVELARATLDVGCRTRGPSCELPVDLVIAERFAEDAEALELDGVDVPDGWMGLDIGPRTAAAYARGDRRTPGRCSGTGRWGRSSSSRSPPGRARSPRRWRRRPGPRSSAAATRPRRSQQFGLADRVTHLSTGGGASLELIEGKKLPGVEALALSDRRRR